MVLLPGSQLMSPGAEVKEELEGKNIIRFNNSESMLLMN